MLHRFLGRRCALLAVAVLTGCGGGGQGGGTAAVPTGMQKEAPAAVISPSEPPAQAAVKYEVAGELALRPLARSPLPRAGTGPSWLTFSPPTVDLTVFPQTLKPFGIIAQSTKVFTQAVYVAIIDAQGVTSPPVSIKGIGPYFAAMNTNPALAPGIHSGNFEVRLCYDTNPLVCAQPVEGSPWRVPYTIEVLDPASLHYARWEAAQTTPGFLDNFALSHRNGDPFVVAAGFYSGVMETWTSTDLGSSWMLAGSSRPSPLTKGFALASDGEAIYLSGGQSISTYGKPLGEYQSHVWKFDGVNWQVKTASAVFSGREDHVMAKVGGVLYVAGGRDAGGTLRDLWKSTDDGVNWSSVSASLPAALGNVTCALNWQNTLLLVGQKVATSADGVNWTVRSGYPKTFPAASTQCSVLNERLFINAVDPNDDAVSSVDLIHWQLERPQALPPVNAPGMAAVNGRLMITTGSGTSQRTTYRTVP